MLETKVKMQVGKDFSSIPADKYTTQIVDVDLVTQKKYMSQEEEDVLNYKFVILDDKPIEGDEKGTRGRFVWKRVPLFIGGEKSWSNKLFRAVLGHELTKEEKENMDPESVVGKQVDVFVEPKPAKDGGKVWDNITNFLKTTKQLEPVADVQPANVVVNNASKAVEMPADEDPESVIADLKK